MKRHLTFVDNQEVERVGSVHGPFSTGSNIRDTISSAWFETCENGVPKICSVFSDQTLQTFVRFAQILVLDIRYRFTSDEEIPKLTGRFAGYKCLGYGLNEA